MLTNNHPILDAQVPLTIFDLDGTLALIEHRRHLVEAPPCDNCNGSRIDPMNSNQCCVCKNGKKRDFKPNWDAFFARCEEDEPNWPVIGVMMSLYTHGEDVRIWSGRDSKVRGKTLMWLHVFTKIPLIKLDDMLKMRPEGDYTPDDILKRQWLESLSARERLRLRSVFDDRDKVVKMWREQGVACFQVAPGEF